MTQLKVVRGARSCGLATHKVGCNVRCQIITTADFSSGTFLIDKPGTYKLCEDITFDPFPPTGNETAAEAYDVSFHGIYNRSSFGLGHFAAIAVASSNVTIALNGFTLEQSVQHALMQRYLALIELANTPFIEGAGPAQFVSSGETFQGASDVRILGPGTLGRSSHHGAYLNGLTALRNAFHVSSYPLRFALQEYTGTRIGTWKFKVSRFAISRSLQCRSTIAMG